jgi:hypothetical protein
MVSGTVGVADMAIRGVLSKINRPVTGVANWIWLVGPGGILWAIMSWVSANVAPIAKYGWGAFVLAGFGAMCALVIVISFGLVGWRYFRPLAPVALIGTDPRAGDEVDNPAKGPPVDAKQIEQIKSALDTIEESGTQAARDIFLLLNFAVTCATVSFLDDLRNQLPGERTLELPELDGPSHVREREFIGRVKSSFRGTARELDVASILEDARVAAESEVRKFSQAQLPPGVDLLTLREWAITRFQSNKLIAYLRGQRRDVEGRIGGARSDLIERFRLRNPS